MTEQIFMEIPLTAADVYLDYITMRLDKRPDMDFDDAHMEALKVTNTYMFIQNLANVSIKPNVKSRDKVVPIRPKDEE